MPSLPVKPSVLAMLSAFAPAQQHTPAHKQRAHRLLTLALALVFGGTTLATPAHAIDNFWVGGDGGDFLDGANWSGGTVPGLGDTAFLTVDADTQTVVLAGIASVMKGVIEGTSWWLARSISSRSSPDIFRKSARSSNTTCG